MSNEVVSRLLAADFHLIDGEKPADIPAELMLSIVTDDGILIESLSEKGDLVENLFESVGKILALQTYIKQQKLTSKYSVALALTLKQYRELQKELRKVLTEEVPLMIL